MPYRFSLICLLALGCASHRAPSTQVSSLAGLTLPLHRAPALRLAVDGSVFHKPALINLEVSSPVTSVTDSCFEDTPRVMAAVKVRQIDGTEQQLPQTELKGLTLGPYRLEPSLVAIEKGADCVVTLGADQLGSYAITVSPTRRKVSFAAAMSKEQLEAQLSKLGEAVLLEVSKDPRTDRPYLPVQVRQREEVLTGTFLLTSSLPTSAISVAAADQAGLHTQAAILEQVAKIAKVELPPELSKLGGLAYEAIDVAPGTGVKAGFLDTLDWPAQGIVGRLGADVWGRFDATFDLPAGALLLSRPRLSVSGDFQRCEQGGVVNEENCFDLEGNTTKDGVEAVATLWRSLPNGGRLYFDVQNDAMPCRIGISFGPTDRGVSSHHLFPWAEAEKKFPECAQALKSATVLKPGLFEESPLEACPGQCAFIESAKSKAASCECAPGAMDPKAEQKLGELFKLMLKEEAKRRDREQEPKDPE